MVHFRVLLSIADGYESIGDACRASALVDQWLAVRNEVGLPIYDSYYHRLRGRLLLKAGDDDEAEKNFRKAIAVAASITAKSEELRSALELARLLIKHSARDEAHRTLAEIYGWFTESFETGDLKEAKSLLDDLEK